MCVRPLRRVLILLCLCLLASASPSFGDTPIWGPATFTRTGGAPVVETREFTAFDPSLAYTLLVENRGVQANVASAAIWINGVQVLGPSDFNQAVDRLERRIVLRLRNTLQIQLASAPGSRLVVTVLAPYAASATVGGQGGTIEVTSPSSPIFGTKITVPAEALDPEERVHITVSFTDALPGALPLGAQKASKVFQIEKDSAYNFKMPVTVTVPFDYPALAADECPLVFYWSPTYAKYRPTTLTAIDRAAGTITFETSHFTLFVGIVVPGISLLAQQFDMDSGFRSAEDGFFHKNFGGYDVPGGSCLGMALYSQWYYAEKKTSDVTGGLYWKYRDGVYDDWHDDLNARELISRAMVASSQRWANINFKIDRLTPFDTAIALWTALWVTREPQTVLIEGTDSQGNGWGHAITAYRWDKNARKFEIYDNNFPGESPAPTLEWSAAFGFHNYSKAAAYPPIRNFAYEGFGTTLEGAEFETYYSGAENGWSSEKFKQIALVEPTLDANGVADVSGVEPITVRGRATGGIARAQYVVVYVNGRRDRVVGIDALTNEFTFTILSLSRPSNTVHLIATDDQRDTWNSWNAYAGFREVTFRVQGSVIFTNPGFETGDFTGWLHETHTWSNPTSGSVVPEKSAVVTPGADSIDPSLQRVYEGGYAARINNSDNNYHISTLSQTVAVPAAGTPQLRFYWAAVLEDPAHPASAQPFLDITVRDEDSDAILYSRHFYSNDPSYSGWRTVSHSWATWRVIPWQTIFIDLSAAAGRRVTVRVTAADCGYGGHGGYVYFDGDTQ